MSNRRLVEEVFEIQETVDKLKAKLRESENALQHLLRTKSSLEHDLNVKNNSLFIDRERCMGLRKTFPLAPRVACYWGDALRMRAKLCRSISVIFQTAVLFSRLSNYSIFCLICRTMRMLIRTRTCFSLLAGANKDYFKFTAAIYEKRFKSLPPTNSIHVNPQSAIVIQATIEKA